MQALELTKKFSDFEISKEILEQLTRLNFSSPTQIQSLSLPHSLARKDLIGLAETGSGKTLAFLLPILEGLLKDRRPYYALILAPTRELCIQIQEQVSALGAAFGVKSVAILGGLDLMTQAVTLTTKKPHIIIGTPGRILHHLENTKGFRLQELKFLVLDEADKLLDLNFEEALDQIMEKLNSDRTTFLFSATMTNKVSKLQRASLKDPVKIEANQTKNQTVQTLHQSYLFIPLKYKDTYLINLLN